MKYDYTEKLNTVTCNDKEQIYPNQRYQQKVSQYYQSIPEARDLQWNDNFFDISNSSNEYDDTERDIVAVFDFNYEQINDYQIKLGLLFYVLLASTAWVYVGVIAWLANTAPTGFYGEYEDYGTYYEAKVKDFTVPLYACAVAFPFFILLGYTVIHQIKWSTYSKHIAITRDGVRYVCDKHKSCCGISMCNIGKISKTIPFDKITDCDIVEPAGAFCCCIQRVLTSVRIDTPASGGSEGLRLELEFAGLVNPHGFKKLVWAMKRRNYSYNNSNQYIDPNLLLLSSATNGYNNTANTRNGAVLETTTTALTTSGIDSNSSTIQCLLRDICTELRENNQLLKEMKSKEGKTNTTTSSVASTGLASDYIEIV